MSYYKPTSLFQKVQKILQLFGAYLQISKQPVRPVGQKALSILMVVPQFDRIGGYEIQAAQLSRSFVECGHMVTVVTDRINNSPPREFRNGFLIRRLQTFSLKMLGALPLFFYLRRHRRSFNVVHAHGVTGFSLFAVRIMRRLDTPVLLKVPTAGDVESLASTNSRTYMRWLKETDLLIAVSEELSQEMRKAGIPGSQIRKIPNFVNTELFKQCDKECKRELRKRLGVENEKTVFLYLGRLEKRKGVEVLLRAWKSDGVLWIVGSGPEESRIKSIAEELKLSNVVFWGETSNPLAFYQAADVFVFPSLKEGAANVVLEAMSTGLPVIATRIGGTVDQMEHEEHGLLIAPGSMDELRHAMDFLASHEKERVEWGQNAAASAREKFDISKITSQYLEIYSEIRPRS